MVHWLKVTWGVRENLCMVEKDLQTYRGMPSNVSVSFDFDGNILYFIYSLFCHLCVFSPVHVVFIFFGWGILYCRYSLSIHKAPHLFIPTLGVGIDCVTCAAHDLPQNWPRMSPRASPHVLFQSSRCQKPGHFSFISPFHFSCWVCRPGARRAEWVTGTQSLMRQGGWLAHVADESSTKKNKCFAAAAVAHLPLPEWHLQPQMPYHYPPPVGSKQKLLIWWLSTGKSMQGSA